MSKDDKIPLTENDKSLIGRYLKEIQDIRTVLGVKSQALDDILGVLLESKGLSPKDYVVDIRQGAMIKRGGENVRVGKEEKGG